MALRCARRPTVAIAAAFLTGCGAGAPAISPPSSPRAPEASVAHDSTAGRGGRGGGCPTFTPAWWNSTYQLRRLLTVSYSGTLAAGYSVVLVFDSAADVTAGRLLASGDDLRVVYWDGSANTELHRHLIRMNSASTEVWFKTQAAITDSSGAYWLYLKNAAPAAPLAAWSDAMAGTSPVYLAADSFESYTAGATLASTGGWFGSAAYTVAADPKNASNKVAKNAGTGANGSYVFAGSYAWTDVALHARYFVQSSTATYMGLLMRAENAAPFHFLFAGYGSTPTQIQFWDCSLNATTDAALASATQFGGAGWGTASNDGLNWHDHVVRVKGTRVRHSIDGTEWFPGQLPGNGFNANTMPAAGRIGLLKGYSNNAVEYYDDVVVRAFVEPEPTVAAGADEAGCDSCAGVTCTALDQCHAAGTCDPATGVCSNPAKADGAGCDDGNACTKTDTCQGGTCSGANPVVCKALDQCHDPGTCTASTGLCSDPVKANGAGCDDGNACTQTDTCQAGICTGGTIVCVDAGQPDVGQPDTGTIPPDGGVVTPPDAGTPDVGSADTGIVEPPDAERPSDVGQPEDGAIANDDAALEDGAVLADSGAVVARDAAAAPADGSVVVRRDAGDVIYDLGGCGCGSAPRTSLAPWALLGLVASLGRGRHRRSLRASAGPSSARRAAGRQPRRTRAAPSPRSCPAGRSSGRPRGRAGRPSGARTPG